MNNSVIGILCILVTYLNPACFSVNELKCYCLGKYYIENSLAENLLDDFKRLEATTGVVLLKKVFLKISLKSCINTCVGVSFLINL